MTTTAQPCPTCHHEDRHSGIAGCTHLNVLEGDGETWCPCTDHAGWERAQTVLPSTPYDGGTSSGHSGSETSAARSSTEDANGTTRARQAQVLRLLEYPTGAGGQGITVQELRAITGWHHGQASGTLSNLHHAGTIARLAETRHKCKVYVLPEYVSGRATEPFGRKPKATTGPTANQVHGAVVAALGRSNLLVSTPQAEAVADAVLADLAGLA